MNFKHQTNKLTLAIAVCLAVSVGFCGPQYVIAQTIAFTDANVETIGKQGRIEDATIVVSDGKIEAVGADVDIPDDARQVSLAGKTVMPGLVDPYFVYKNSGRSTSRTITFNGRTFTIPGSTRFTVGSFSRIGKYFDPYKFDFMPALRTGIVTANLVSDGHGLSALGKSHPDPSPEILFQPEGFLFAKVTNQTTALDVIRKPLTTQSKSSSSASRRPTSTSSSTNDDTKKRWEAVKKGEAPIFVNVNNAASVAHLLLIAEKAEKSKVVLVATGPNLYQSLNEIKDNENITVILQPGIDQVPYSTDLMNVSRTLVEKEIPFAISMSLSSSQMSANQDDPMFPLAMLVKTGVEKNKVLRSVTIEPAKILGIDELVGTLEKGKQADFLVFDGNPLESGSRLTSVYSNGKKIHEQ